MQGQWEHCSTDTEGRHDGNGAVHAWLCSTSVMGLEAVPGRLIGCLPMLFKLGVP